MIRTIVVLLIATVMSFSMIGCGGEKPAPQEEPAEEEVGMPEEGMTEEMAPAEEGEEHPTGEMEEEGSGAK
jgi:hypothetical protein